MWMNEGEIEQAVDRFASHPVLGKGARFLSAFRDEVNAHSDGWAYWKLPAHAAEKLMTLLNGHLFAGMGAYPRLPAPTEADLKKAIAPIKAFYTRRGYKAGMVLPPLDEPKPTPQPAADWAGCCRASQRIWQLFNAMQGGKPEDLKFAPTATTAEIIAGELGIKLPGE